MLSRSAQPLLLMQKETGNSNDQQPTGPAINEVITIHAVAQPTRKRRGEASEAAFLARATSLGFTVCIPWGDSERYDSVVDLGHGLLRVQVKSATRYAETRYRVRTTGASGTIYTAAEIDFLVAYIVPRRYLVHHPRRRHRTPQRHPLLSPRPPPLPRHVRKIPRSLVPPRPAKKSALRKDIPRLCRSKSVEIRCAVCPQRG